MFHLSTCGGGHVGHLSIAWQLNSFESLAETTKTCECCGAKNFISEQSAETRDALVLLPHSTPFLLYKNTLAVQYLLPLDIMACVQPQVTTSPWASAEVPSHFRDSHSEQYEQDLPISSNELTSSCASASATQPSTPVTSACSAIRLSLLNYIGLGCLCLDDSFKGYSFESYYSLAWASEWSWAEVCLTAEQESALGNNVVELLHAGWIRMFSFRTQIPSAPNGSIFRIYLLAHDVGRLFIDRRSKTLKAALQELLRNIDVNPVTWYGRCDQGKQQKFDQWASAEEYSLFYLFNKLPSPDPSPENIRNQYTRQAVQELLDSASSIASDASEPLRGLKTKLYPYQARSAALMIQREAAPQLQLDPRLEARRSPDGQKFYYGARDSYFLKMPRYYEPNRGGILSETMVCSVCGGDVNRG